MSPSKIVLIVAGMALVIPGLAVADDDRCEEVEQTLYEMGCTYQDPLTNNYYYRVYNVPNSQCYPYDLQNPYAFLVSEEVRDVHQDTYLECDPYPEARFYVKQVPNHPVGQNVITLKGGDSTGVDITYEWSYSGQYGSYQGTGPSMSVQSMGGYTATIELTVTDKYGDSSTKTKNVYIEEWDYDGPIQ